VWSLERPRRRGGEHVLGVDPARGVALAREWPVVVRGRVGLLQLHDRRAAAQPLQPGVGVTIGRGRAGDALVADVEAEHDRDVLVVACGQQPQHYVHGRRLADAGGDHQDQQPKDGPGNLAHPLTVARRRGTRAPTHGVHFEAMDLPVGDRLR
jgi:hypothetical protein